MLYPKKQFSYGGATTKESLLHSLDCKKKDGIKKLKVLSMIGLSSIAIASGDAYASDRYEALETQTVTTKTGAMPKSYNIIGVGLFAGNDWVSKLIRGVTWSNVSHVGMILADADNENDWYCFESTGSASEVLSGQYPHARITPWHDVVKDYDGKIGYRLLVFKDQDRTAPKPVSDFVEEHNGKSFTKNLFKLVWALRGWNEEHESQDTFFCSELTAKMLMDLKIIQDGIAGNFLPSAFVSKQSTKLSLSSGISLTPMFQEKGHL